MDFEEFQRHFPKKISKSLVHYVTNTVLKESRYLFFKTVAGVQFAHCTHCNKRHRSVIKLKHKQEEKVTCPHCKSSCHVRAAGISRRYMEDKGVLVWYEKSRINPQAITARVMAVHRNYSESFKNVETKYHAGHMYLFEPGKSHYWDWGGKRKTVFSAFDAYFKGGSYPRFMSHANIRRAVKGTPFQYSTWDQFTKYENHRYVSDMVEFFDLAARYPCIEYLSKLGFQKVIWTRLYRQSGLHAINWRGKTIDKVLRMSKQRINEIRQTGLEWSPKELKYFQEQLKAGKTISAADAFVLSKVDNDSCQSDLKKLELLAPKDTILFYLLKQYRRNNQISITTTLYDYKDYLGQCDELGLNLKEIRYLFPNDLHASHQKLTKRIKHKRDQELMRLIKNRQKELEHHKYEGEGLLIRPIQSLDELFAEGKALNHCVGGYAEQYAKGLTDLFVVRKANDPDKPYYTLQITDKSLTQCRGKKNSAMTPEVKAHVDRFILQLKRKKRRTMPASRQKVREEAVV